MSGLLFILLIGGAVAGAFAFGAIPTPFHDLAQLVFFAFLALLAASLVFALLRREHGQALLAGGRLAAFTAVVAAVSIVGYAWIKGDWNAERLGQTVDRAVAQAGAETQQLMHRGNEGEQHAENN